MTRDESTVEKQFGEHADEHLSQHTHDIESTNCTICACLTL